MTVQGNLTDQVNKIFSPGIGVDIVFNPDSLSPIVKSSIIYDCDHKSKTMIISQTTPPVLPNFGYEAMGITTLTTNEFSQKIRVGMNCNILKFIDNYSLTNSSAAKAILLEYRLPVIETNLRSAYRLELASTFQAACKLIYKGQTYLSGQYFKVHNISATGIGLLIPKKAKKKRNFFIDIKPGTECKIGLALRNIHSNTESVTISVTAKVIWKNTNFNPLSGFAGLKFIKISKEDEAALSKFIHEAQVYIIREMSRLLD